MISPYINELAKRAFEEFKDISSDQWKSLEKISRYLPEKPGSSQELEQKLQSNVRLQAEVAWHISYTPSKWLLESELEDINKRRENAGIAWLDGKGWHGEGACEMQECEEKAAVDVAKPDDVYKRADRSKLMGLCLSGGGIRSATFNLGILQALAEHDLLCCFDYLSSVSGGGYIHQWLAAWIERQKREKVRHALEAKLSDPKLPQDQINALQRHGLPPAESRAAEKVGFKEVLKQLVP
jgi:hypothetical protein